MNVAVANLANIAFDKGKTSYKIDADPSIMCWIKKDHDYVVIDTVTSSTVVKPNILKS